VVTLRPVGYSRRSSQQVPVNPFAVVVSAMRFTMGLVVPQWLNPPIRGDE